MTCKKCGAALTDDAKFCPQCGTKQEDVHAPVAENAPRNKEDDRIENLGRASYILSFIGAGLYLMNMPLLALIISSVARKKIKQYTEQGGELKRLTLVGNIVSLVSLVLSAVGCASVVAVLAFVLLFYIAYFAFVAIAVLTAF